MFIETFMQSTELRRSRHPPLVGCSMEETFIRNALHLNLFCREFLKSGMKAEATMTTTALRTARAMPPRWGLIGVWNVRL